MMATSSSRVSSVMSRLMVAPICVEEVGGGGCCHPIAAVGLYTLVAQHREHVFERRSDGTRPKAVIRGCPLRSKCLTIQVSAGTEPTKNTILPWKEKWSRAAKTPDRCRAEPRQEGDRNTPSSSANRAIGGHEASTARSDVTPEKTGRAQ